MTLRARPALAAALAAGVVASFFTAFAAPASPLTILSDERRVYAEAYYSVDASWGSDYYDSYDEEVATAPFFDASVDEEMTWLPPGGGLLVGRGTASQTSTVSSAGITASGSASSTFDSFSGSGGDPEDVGSFWWEYSEADGWGESTLDVVFRVDAFTYFLLDGTLDAPAGSLHILLQPITGITTDDFDLVLTGDDVLSRGGALLPGSYRLYAQATGGADGVAYDFAFVVPEPSTGLLLAFGLCALSRRRRSSRATRPSAAPPAIAKTLA